MIKDFSLVFSPIMTDRLLSSGNAEDVLAYAYLMRHQFCRLHIFSDEEVAEVLKQLLGEEYGFSIAGSREFTLSTNDTELDKCILWLIDTLCMSLVWQRKENDGTIRFKLKNIFDNDEVRYNRRAITAHN